MFLVFQGALEFTFGLLPVTEHNRNISHSPVVVTTTRIILEFFEYRVCILVISFSLIEITRNR
jgi:hypothetical protein